MSASVLVQGKLWDDPQSKVSKNGNTYAAATIAESSGEVRRWWKVRAFNDAAVALLRLRAQESVSVQGVLDVQIYEKAGQPCIGYSVLADHVLALRQPKERAAKQVQHSLAKKASADRRLARHAGVADADLNDALPW